jgi:hypothetical protein
MKRRNTIPLNLDDWLDGFQSSLEGHPRPREIGDYRHRDQGQEEGLSGFFERVASNSERGDAIRSFAI